MPMPWAMLDDADRLQWTLAPLEGVGPIRFGMQFHEVMAVLDGALLCRFGVGNHQEAGLSARLTGPRQTIIGQAAVTLYFTPDEQSLYCVMVDALLGPQVSLGGLGLVGQVPSRLEDDLADLAEAEGAAFYISQRGDPAVEAFGVLLRVQRAGDVLLSRPVFVGREWAHRLWDTSESWVPEAVWRQCC